MIHTIIVPVKEPARLGIWIIDSMITNNEAKKIAKDI